MYNNKSVICSVREPIPFSPAPGARLRLSLKKAQLLGAVFRGLYRL